MIRLKRAWREDLNWIWISADFQQSRNQTLERGEFAPVNCLLLCQLAEEKLLQFKTQILSKILSWNLERSTVLRSPLFSYFYPFLSFPLSLLNLPKIRRKMLSKRSKADRCFSLRIRLSHLLTDLLTDRHLICTAPAAVKGKQFGLMFQRATFSRVGWVEFGLAEQIQ